MKGVSMRRISLLPLLLVLTPALASLTIGVGDYNYSSGITGNFYHLTGGTWSGWDGGVDSWDFSGINGPNYAQFDVLAKSGSPDGSDFPNAQYAERIDQSDVGEVWFYSSLDSHYRQHGATIPVLGDPTKVVFNPVISFWDLPLSVGKSWSYDFTYSFLIWGFISVTVEESHSKEVVAAGRVKVPASNGEWWPCLVVRKHVVVSDNFGVTDKDVWIYSWIVPEGFIGQSGVASIESVDGAGPDFTQYSNRYVLLSSNITPPVWSIRESSWGSIKAGSQ